MNITEIDLTSAPIGVWADNDFTTVELYCNSSSFTLNRSDYDDAPWLDALKRIFDPKVAKIGHNIKPLMRSLNMLKIDHGNWIFDTALACYIVDSANGELELNRALEIFNKENTPADSNAHAISILYNILQTNLERLNMTELYREIALPLCEVLADMEDAGIAIDANALTAFGVKLDKKIATLQQEIFDIVGRSFNINSPKQLGVVLFEELKLPPSKKTKSGYSTDSEVLENLSQSAPVAKLIIEYRQLTKLKSTYVDGLMGEIGADGRIHCQFNMMTTATGRLSSSAPNLQNIPIRTPLGSELRAMFIPQNGCAFIDADYSQIELRVLADIAQDRTMIEAFRAEEDIHSVTAQQVFGESSGEMRRRAKAVNFGIVYGISSFALAMDIGVTQEEAKSYMTSYLEKYSGVRNYMTQVVKDAKEQGYVSTLKGRRRNLPELSSKIFKIRSFGERVALNTPIQGSAADIIFAAMIGVYRRLKNEQLKSCLILQIHDELLIEAPKNEVEQVKIVLKEEMEQAVKLSVPLTVDMGIGDNWLETK